MAMLNNQRVTIMVEITKKHDGFWREFSDGEEFRNMFCNGPNMGIQPMNGGTWNSKVRLKKHEEMWELMVKCGSIL